MRRLERVQSLQPPLYTVLRSLINQVSVSGTKGGGAVWGHSPIRQPDQAVEVEGSTKEVGWIDEDSWGEADGGCGRKEGRKSHSQLSPLLRTYADSLIVTCTA